MDTEGYGGYGRDTARIAVWLGLENTGHVFLEKKDRLIYNIYTVTEDNRGNRTCSDDFPWAFSSFYLILVYKLRVVSMGSGGIRKRSMAKRGPNRSGVHKSRFQVPYFFSGSHVSSWRLWNKGSKSAYFWLQLSFFMGSIPSKLGSSNYIYRIPALSFQGRIKYSSFFALRSCKSLDKSCHIFFFIGFFHAQCIVQWVYLLHVKYDG